MPASLAAVPGASNSLQASLLVEDLEHRLPHLTRFLAGVEAAPDTCLLVVADDGLGLLVVGDEALLQSVGVVVASLDERLASDIVLHVVLGRVEGGVV